MSIKIETWLKISIINLLFVALLGTIMRYKIGFELPFLNYKHLLHSHSHFAFSGWISHTLTVLMIVFLKRHSAQIDTSKYSFLILGNLITAYGMLVAFIIQGYAFWSILFSTLSLFISYGFAFFFFKDLKKIDKNNVSKKWFAAALFFYLISSLGPFGLAYMMATKNIVQLYYINSIYYYLHFQYNGWFFFACIGLLADSLQLKTKTFHKVFPWFFISAIITFLLSIVYLKLPIWLFVIMVAATVLQLVLWLILFVDIYKNNRHEFKVHPIFLQSIIKIIALCVTIKLVIQLLSSIPSLNKLVYGFRFIIIAYLHLVLLGIISLYLLFNIYSNKYLKLNNTIKYGIMGFVFGVFLNELILAIQGFSAFGYVLVPKVNEMLFTAAIIMLSSLLFVVIPTLRSKELPN